MQNKKKSSIIKDALALFAITLVAALALGYVYEITKDPIQKAKLEEKAAAYVSVFPEAKIIDAKNEELMQHMEESKTFLNNNGFEQSTINEICVAKDEAGKAIGYVMTITSHEGYSGDIQFSMGVRADGTLTKLEMLTIKETAGLGMKAADEEFKGQFSAINTQAFELVKAQVQKSSEVEINAISGATITSKAVTNTVNASLAFVSQLLDQGVGGVVRE